jgi:erythromycin esterase-like protein
MEIKTVLPSRPDSIERRFHDCGLDRLWLDMTALDPAAAAALSEPLLARFIGVIYRPETERWSHYYEVELAGQYDHYVFFDETRALAALPAPRPRGPGAEEALPETFPFGL